jgi:hypothetical protein
MWCSRTKVTAVQITNSSKLHCHGMHHQVGMPTTTKIKHNCTSLPQIIWYWYIGTRHDIHCNLNGCYLSLDTVRGDPICSDFQKSDKEEDGNNTWEPPTWLMEMQRTGHSTNFTPMSLLEMRMRPPTEGALCLTSNKMAVGMRKCDAGRILRLFNWTEIDEALLTQLPYKSEGGGSLASKKYKHVCLVCLSCSLQRHWCPARISQTTQPVSGS